MSHWTGPKGNDADSHPHGFKDLPSPMRREGGAVKELLARQLLSAVVGIDDEEMNAIANHLTALSAVKYDDYGGYSPGVKFLESLAVWLDGFAAGDRRAALDFVLKRLAYVSSAELDHLVGTVYYDVLRPRFVREAASELRIPAWRVATVAASKEFKARQRRTLILGMSDGARLDKLRRSSSLSTEQFHLVTFVDEDKRKDLKKKLAKALLQIDPTSPIEFDQVVLVDDFSASGTTMLRPAIDDDGNLEKDEHGKQVWTGKLAKLRKHLADLKTEKVISADAKILILLYLMSDDAHSKLNDRMVEAGFGSEYELAAVHKFSTDFPLSAGSDPEFWDLCERYYRKAWENEHTEIAGDFRFGYGSSALPLVLHHNAPNNAPPIIWKDETPDESGDEARWIGVFPRHERHHPGRA